MFEDTVKLLLSKISKGMSITVSTNDFHLGMNVVTCRVRVSSAQAEVLGGWRGYEIFANRFLRLKVFKSRLTTDVGGYIQQTFGDTI